MKRKQDPPYSLRLSREDQALLQEQAQRQGKKPHAVALEAVRVYLQQSRHAS